eukprot:TRINITY_DN828_c1_g1_i3.p1 TRINITY_DN828_c1_g1~~TRINITY_DN828_c1_g1_i3.p1  ORF type:complete len:368 (-),score=32.88 TRINITY_DN828_c1_g1_i3:475-1578(-)
MPIYSGYSASTDYHHHHHRHNHPRSSSASTKRRRTISTRQRKPFKHDLDLLPPELFHIIFARISLEHISTASLVCRRWRLAFVSCWRARLNEIYCSNLHEGMLRNLELHICEGLTVSRPIDRLLSYDTGTFNELLRFIISPHCPDSFMDTFLSTYRFFATPDFLIFKLVQCLQVKAVGADEDKKKETDPEKNNESSDEEGVVAVEMDAARERERERVANRVVSCFVRWMRLSPCDFVRRFQSVRSFAESLDDEHLSSCLRIEVDICERSRMDLFSSSRVYSTCPKPMLPKRPIMSLLDIPPKEFARQLTLFSSKRFHRLQSCDLVCSSLFNLTSKRLRKFEVLTELLSYWIVRQIVRPTVKETIKVH